MSDWENVNRSFSVLHLRQILLEKYREIIINIGMSCKLVTKLKNFHILIRRLKQKK